MTPVIPYKLSRTAQRDIASIEAYTVSQWGTTQAKRYLAMLETQIFAAASMPGAGKRRDDIRSGCRSIEAEEHIVFYFMRENHLEVLRVLHKRMDISRHFH